MALRECFLRLVENATRAISEAFGESPQNLPLLVMKKINTPKIDTRQNIDDSFCVAIPDGDYTHVVTRCMDAANHIVSLVDVYQTSGNVLMHAVALSNRTIALRLRQFQSGEITTAEAAAGAFMLAMKFGEVEHPSIPDLARLTKRSNAQIKNAEVFIVAALEWNIHITTGISTKPSSSMP